MCNDLRRIALVDLERFREETGFSAPGCPYTLYKQ
jgi:hypothetical protein